MIHGVKVIALTQIADQRGRVLHMLRSDAPHYMGFGEIYFSLVNPGSIKAWNLQVQMTRHYAVPWGTIKVVLFDDRPESATSGSIEEILLGADNYKLLVIPPSVWSGVVNPGTQPALIADCTTAPYDPTQVRRRDPFDPMIPYSWDTAPR